MDVSALSGPRFDTALERFCEGERISYDDHSFALVSDGYLECYAPSSYRAENATAESVERDVAVARAVLDRFVSGSPAFAAVVAGRPCRYVVLDDYGMGAMEVGRSEP